MVSLTFLRHCPFCLPYCPCCLSHCPFCLPHISFMYTTAHVHPTVPSVYLTVPSVYPHLSPVYPTCRLSTFALSVYPYAPSVCPTYRLSTTPSLLSVPPIACLPHRPFCLHHLLPVPSLVNRDQTVAPHERSTHLDPPPPTSEAIKALVKTFRVVSWESRRGVSKYTYRPAPPPPPLSLPTLSLSHSLQRRHRRRPFPHLPSTSQVSGQPSPPQLNTRTQLELRPGTRKFRFSTGFIG